MVMSRQNISWLALLVIAAITLSGQNLSMSPGSSLDLPASAIQVVAGNSHDNPSPPPADSAAWRSERHASVGKPVDALWVRLRHGFALPAGRSTKVQLQLDRLLRDRGGVERIMQQGTPYLYHILDEINRRGLPTELALLPAVESAFSPFARSPQGAAGLWQFMPRTASQLGLRKDAWYDGRRDVIAATAAALDYLTQLQQRFDGDWLLALAAYNAGPRRVQRAIEHNRKNRQPVDFWHLRLPDETRAYVPKLLALRTLIAEPVSYGLDLPTVPDAPYFTAIDAVGQLYLEVAARMAGVGIDEIRRLNPAHTRQTVGASRSHRLLIPTQRAATFRTRLADIDEEQRLHWVRHPIRAGETLSAIARRYRISVAHLQEFNQLRGSTIMAGDLLIVPVVQS